MPVIALAVLSLGLSAWLLGRVTSWKRRIAAAAGFALTVALVAAAIGLVANRNMMWVSTLSDLTSAISGPADHGKVSVEEVPDGSAKEQPARKDAGEHGDNTKPEQPDEIPVASAVTATDRSQQNAFSYDSATKLWHATFHGTASGLERSVTMWLPEGVTPGDGEKLNVILFNHGYPGTDEGVVNALDIDKILGNAVKTGELPPTAFVVPDIGVGGQPDCVDITGRPPVETFFTQDVPRILVAQLPNVSHSLSDWAVAGISSGAYCAPVLQMRHTDAFFAALSIGGYDRPILGALSRADQASQRAFTISTMVAEAEKSASGGASGGSDGAGDARGTKVGSGGATGASPAPATDASQGDSAAQVRLFIAGATSDNDSRALVAQLASLQVAHVQLGFDLDPKGGHSWSTWKRQLPKALTWLAQQRLAYLQAAQMRADAATHAAAPAPSASESAGEGSGTAGSGDMADLEKLKRAATPANAAPTPFELRGTGTLVVLVLISLAAVVALMCYGPRIVVVRRNRTPKHALHAVLHRSARQRLRALAAFGVRAVLILLVAVLVFFTLFALDNRVEVYFATWEDLVAHWIDLFVS